MTIELEHRTVPFELADQTEFHDALEELRYVIATAKTVRDLIAGVLPIAREYSQKIVGEAESVMAFATVVRLFTDLNDELTASAAKGENNEQLLMRSDATARVLGAYRYLRLANGLHYLKKSGYEVIGE